MKRHARFYIKEQFKKNDKISRVEIKPENVNKLGKLKIASGKSFIQIVNEAIEEKYEREINKSDGVE